MSPEPRGPRGHRSPLVLNYDKNCPFQFFYLYSPCPVPSDTVLGVVVILSNNKSDNKYTRKPVGCINHIYQGVWIIVVNFIIGSLTGPLEGKQNDISLLFKQRNKHISILIVSAKMFPRPTEAINDSCSLKQVFLKIMRNPWKTTTDDFSFH